MNWFLEWVSSQNSKKLKTPFLSVYIITFALSHTHLIFLLFPLGERVFDRMTKINVEISRIFIQWDLFQNLFTTLIVLAVYYVVNGLVRVGTVAIEDRVFPSIREKIVKGSLSAEEAQHMRSDMTALTTANESLTDRLGRSRASESKLSEELEAAKSNAESQKVLAETTNNKTKENARRAYGQMIYKWIEGYLVGQTAGKDNARSMLMQIELKVKKSIAEADTKVATLLKRVVETPHTVKHDRYLELLELGLVDADPVDTQEPLTGLSLLKELYSEKTPVKRELNFYGEAWLMFHSYYANVESPLLPADISATLVPSKTPE